MHILFVEDNKSFAADVLESIDAKKLGIRITSAVSRDAALLEISRDQIFDLIILDLKIPTQDEGLDIDATHGHAVFHSIQSAMPGTPIYILTGSEPDHFATDLSRHSERVDLFGSGKSLPTILYFPKDKVDLLVDEVLVLATDAAATEKIELNRGGKTVELTHAQKRLLKVFTRLSGGNSCFVERAGGLSDALVLKVMVKRDGDKRGVSIAKLGLATKIRAERDAYENDVKLLTAGAFAPVIQRIEKGVGLFAGVFYSLADEYGKTLFEVIRDDVVHAPTVISDLGGKLARWTDVKKTSKVAVSSIRKRLLSDEKLAELKANFDLRFIDEVERQEVTSSFSCIHGDLHGGNVLVNDRWAPVLIDFGDVGDGPSCLDPVTLELSLLFHPDGCGRTPQLVDLVDHWPSIDFYLEKHSLAPAIRACREWAHHIGASDKDVLAAAYAYTLRQLKYDTVPPDVTLRLLKCVSAQILSVD